MFLRIEIMENEDTKFCRSLLSFILKTFIFSLTIVLTLYFVNVNNLNLIKIKTITTQWND